MIVPKRTAENQNLAPFRVMEIKKIPSPDQPRQSHLQSHADIPRATPLKIPLPSVDKPRSAIVKIISYKEQFPAAKVSPRRRSSGAGTPEKRSSVFEAARKPAVPKLSKIVSKKGSPDKKIYDFKALTTNVTAGETPATRTSRCDNTQDLEKSRWMNSSVG